MVVAFYLCAVITVLVLSAYAAHLLWRLKKQNTRTECKGQQKIRQRNQNIFDSVTTLCMVGIQGQCDLSEISIRVYCIMDYIQGKDRVNMEAACPALSELYHIVEAMPRGETRATMPKQVKMKEKALRLTSEARLSDAIIKELEWLKEHVTGLLENAPRNQTNV